uniref:Extracellular membrane protein CFEM domain-containing protein n=1 Tax=Bionectria ochroleuca TaxID=29856 RepID=A0A8H7N491_BIOOC
MRSAAFTLFAAGAAAQFTLPPLANFAAVNADSCDTVAPVITSCYSKFGGSNGMLTADPNAIIGCACCTAGSNLAPAYSGCSSELRPSSSSAAGVYGSLYSICQLGATCGGSTATATRSGSSSSSRSSGSASASASGSSRTITSAPSTRTSASSSPNASGNSQACYDMLDMYSQCVSSTKGFSDLPFQSQAPCYCCSTGRNTVTWHDDLDNYAATCAQWASSVETSVYSVASRFASFCHQFSDACDSAATSTSSSSSSRSTSGASSGGSVTGAGQTTATQTGAAATTTTQGGDATQTRAGAFAGIVALSALFLVL